MLTITAVFNRQEHIVRVTLNRPEAGNAINLQLLQELQDICRQVSQDDEIHVMIITGSGEVFCLGREPEETLNIPGAAAIVSRMDKVVIAAINGDALGVGLELALACDIRLAVDSARFGLPQVSQGMIPDDGGTQRLPRIVGKAKAVELILTGDVVTAGQALEIGLVSKLFAHDKLLPESDALGKSVASKAPIAVRYIKEAVNKGLDLTLEQGLHLEADLYFIIQTTADRTEGIKAFLEKRPPGFKGQ